MTIVKKARNWVVLSVADASYRIHRGITLDELATHIGCDPKRTDVNGTYIGHRSPNFQVIEIEASTIYDFYE